jgi:tetratricopeptide (TPR) repeat protein
MFVNIRSLWDRHQAMREMKALQRDEDEELDYSDNNPLHLATVSLEIGDLDGALRHWNTAWSRHQRYVKQSPDTLAILLRLKLFDEAEAIMLEGLKLSPGEARYREGYALVAERRGDLTEAVARWRQTRKKFPNAWRSYVNAGRCLVELRCLDEAEVLFKQAVSKFPDRIDAWLAHARVAEARTDWALALLRWQAVNENFSHVVGVLGQARAMIQLGETREADRFLVEKRPGFPAEPEVAVQLARIAEISGDTELAIERWSFMRQRFPQFQEGYRESARFLQSIGRDAETEALLLDSQQRFPSETWQPLH